MFDFKHQRPYLVYNLTARGRRLVATGPIVLPVPISVRELERLEEEKKQNTLAELKDKGVDLQQIPQEELEPGEGEARGHCRTQALVQLRGFNDSARTFRLGGSIG